MTHDPGGIKKLPRLGLRRGHVEGFGPLRALLDFKLDFSTFFERPVTFTLNGRKMHKYITATRALDKSVAFRFVKPLDGTFLSHNHVPHSNRRPPPDRTV